MYFREIKKKHTAAKHYTVSILEGHHRGRANPGKRPLSSSSVKKKNRYAGGSRHRTKPRVVIDRRCTAWRHCNSPKHRDCNARACRSACNARICCNRHCNISNTVQKETENTLGYKRSTLNLTASPAIPCPHHPQRCPAHLHPRRGH